MDRRCVVLLVSFLCSASFAAAETMPRNGTFTGYFFVDRWDQGVFACFFVKPGLTKQLQQEDWHPISLSCDEIKHPMNPGAAMIHQINKVAPVPKPAFEIRLKLDKRQIAFGTDTTLRIKVRNNSDQPLQIHRRDFNLLTTVHKRGTHPDHEVERDEIYDCFKNLYGFGRRDSMLRATMTEALFTNQGVIEMRRGAPVLTRKTGGKRVGLYAEQRPTIPKDKTKEFVYSIGHGWLINEYELQIQYRLREDEKAKQAIPYIMSPPVSLDVGTPKHNGK